MPSYHGTDIRCTVLMQIGHSRPHRPSAQFSQTTRCPHSNMYAGSYSSHIAQIGRPLDAFFPLVRSGTLS